MNLPVEPKPSQLRKYIYEYALCALAGAVITLFLMFNDLNKFVRTDLLEQNLQMQRTIEKNTSVLYQLENQQRFTKP